ncbi:Hypothetical_protein [Hexamita inflata]|uniref:Hypothetical_protein n=1 Tax=Hexamita inflata TaxID=28002 RepID=A0AA86PPT1_9EUKA|nr:Hypothetical protein HINF_LOCUS29787 [Hexamita inflata]
MSYDTISNLSASVLIINESQNINSSPRAEFAVKGNDMLTSKTEDQIIERYQFMRGFPDRTNTPKINEEREMNQNDGCLLCCECCECFLTIFECISSCFI